MLQIVRHDAPWVWGFHPKSFALQHVWVSNAKPHEIANNTLKYLRIDPARRTERRAAWNKPVWWPLGFVLLAVAASIVPAVIVYRRREFGKVA
jgi:hypothetical protein